MTSASADGAALRDALALNDAAPAIDLHADTPLLFPFGYDIASRHDPPLGRPWPFGHVDLPRMREGGLWGQFFGVVTFPYLQRDLPGAARRRIEALKRRADGSAGALRLCLTGGDVRAARAASARAALLGIEGAHSLGGRLDHLETFARLGVRYLGFLHFTRNEAGYPAKGYGRDDSKGLTRFGAALVEEANRLGVIVDLTHLNRRGFMEAAARTRAPAIVSHTGVTGVNPHWRNIDDEQIRAVARTGGVAGVIFSQGFLGGGSLEAVVRHLDHLRQVGGEDLPALGSDFDGAVLPPRGLEDVSRLPALTAALKRAGWRDEALLKLLGRNALRVLDAVPPPAAAGAGGAVPTSPPRAS